MNDDDKSDAEMREELFRKFDEGEISYAQYKYSVKDYE